MSMEASVAEAETPAAAASGSTSPTVRLPLLMGSDVERGGSCDVERGGSSPSVMRRECQAVKIALKWHQDSIRHLNALELLFSHLYGGELSGLAEALVSQDSEHLPRRTPRGPQRTAEHLSKTVNSCQDVITDHLDRNQGSRCKGTVEILQVLGGKADKLDEDAMLNAYAMLAVIVLRVPVHIKAPVCYNEDMRQKMSFMLGGVEEPSSMESGHTRLTFDMASVEVKGVQALHLAIDQDAKRIKDGKSAIHVKQLLEAQADVNVHAYYETEAKDFQDHHRRLRVAVSPIHLAVDRDSVDLVSLLMQYQASPETRAVFDMRADYTPLHLAVAKGFQGVAQTLIDFRANPAETDLSGKNCFEVAAQTLRLQPARTCTFIFPEEEAQHVMERCLTSSGSDLPRAPTWRPSERSLAMTAKASTTSWDASMDFIRVGIGYCLFEECVRDMLRCETEDASPGGPSLEDLQLCIAKHLDGGDVNDIYKVPLAPGRFYKRSKELSLGCLLHFATDLAVAKEEAGEEDSEAIVCLVLKASADVHARAHYKTWGIAHSCTALHIAAAGGAPKALALLLDAGASVEAMVTNATKPHYTPLLDAASEGHYEACELLLRRKANPNVPNRLGRTCLHNAVLDGRSSLACLLAKGGSDVTLADSIFQETPLLCTSRAKGGKYPVADMLCLCRAFQNGCFSLLHDLSSLATCREQLTLELLDYVLQSPSTEAVDVRQKKEQLLNQVRRVCVEGKPDEFGVTPGEQIAKILEAAPLAGVRLLADVLMVTPDVQDAVHGTLPVYANLQMSRHSWLPWRRMFGNVEPLLTHYEPDIARRKDGREWPCWLFDSQTKIAEPSWHRHFVQTPSKTYITGNHMVQVKVLLLESALNPRILLAIARSHELDIFAVMPVRALISFAYFHLVRDVILFEKVLELIGIVSLVVWARTNGAEGIIAHRACWSLCAAVVAHDIIVRLVMIRKQMGRGWTLASIHRGFENTWQPVVILINLPLLFCCAHGDHDLDAENGQLVRALVGATIILRAFRLIMLFRYGDTYGTGILAVYNAFQGVFTMLSIMVACFLAFATAYYVMRKEGGSAPELLVNVYRGLMLGDEDSLQEMSQIWGGGLGNTLMIFGTCVFTVYLLNIMIAVLTAEYYKADRQAPLILWKERAFKCSQTLLGPVLPWSFAGICPRPLHGRASSWSCCCRRAPAASPLASPRSGQEVSEIVDQEAYGALVMVRLADVLGLGLLAAAVYSFLMPVHAVWSAVLLALALVIFRARLLRGRFVGAKQKNKKFYLWVCHRSDYSHLRFKSEEVEKEHIDELKDKVDRMEDLLHDIHRRMISMSSQSQVGIKRSETGRNLVNATVEFKEE